jgi:hypothetical protein
LDFESLKEKLEKLMTSSGTAPDIHADRKPSTASKDAKGLYLVDELFDALRRSVFVDLRGEDCFC